MKKRILALMLILALTMVIASGCSGTPEASEQTVWRFGHEETVGAIQDIYAHEFKRLVEERTDGDITVEIYRTGEIGGVMDYLEFQQGGLLDFSIVNPGTSSTTVPENNVFYNHFLLPEEDEQIQELLRTSKGVEMLNEINEENELKVLDWFYEGWNAWTADKPIRSPEDFEGVSIRTMASPLIVSSYQAYNANPTPMPYMEVYTGLQLKQIDAQVNPVFAIQEMGFYEVQDYLINARQDGFVAALVTQPDFYDQLDPEMQKMVDEIAYELNDFIIEEQAELNEKRLEMIKESSDIEIIELTPEERDVFREASGPAREVYRNSVGDKGKEILEIIREDSARISEEGNK